MDENSNPTTPNFEEIDKAASERGELFYLDPETGLYVQTTYALAQRGACCANDCRHCPYSKTL